MFIFLTVCGNSSFSLSSIICGFSCKYLLLSRLSSFSLRYLFRFFRPSFKLILKEGLSKLKIARRKVPKGTNFDNKTDKEIEEIEGWINGCPRRIHGYRSTGELFTEELEKLA